MRLAMTTSILKNSLYPNSEGLIKSDHEPKKERRVGFTGLDSDKEEPPQAGFVCKVVGGVVQKIPVEQKHSPSQSPTVRRRPKMGRKKVDRRVSCKDLGKGDCEGYLFKKRIKSGPLTSQWQKRWCVIKDYSMFCYHDKEALKAEVVIHLPAFKVSPVDGSEVKTKKSAFKIHNSGTSFCFASDRREDMSKWMNKMGLAAIAYDKDSHRKQTLEQEKHKDIDRLKESDKHKDSDFSETDEEPDPEPKPAASGNDDPDTRSVKSVDSLQPELRDSTPEDFRTSQNDLSIMIRKQSQKGHNIYGEDLNKQRRSVISRDLVENLSPDIAKFRKIKCLERTLKAKQKELEEIDALLGSVSPAKLTMYHELHTSDSE